jgi:hypothetical protein
MMETKGGLRSIQLNEEGLPIELFDACIKYASETWKDRICNYNILHLLMLEPPKGYVIPPGHAAFLENRRRLSTEHRDNTAVAAQEHLVRMEALVTDCGVVGADLQAQLSLPSCPDNGITAETAVEVATAVMERCELMLSDEHVGKAAVQLEKLIIAILTKYKWESWAIALKPVGM